MATDYKFQGWLGLDKESVKGKMVWQGYEPKPWEETDIDIKITHCGICASDLHTLRSGWGATDYPVCVGHEIVGQAVRVGSQVPVDIKVGDRVGVGAQSGACHNQKGDCEACADNMDQHCKYSTDTFNSNWPDGSKSYGGYADYWRGKWSFVVKIPDAIPSDQAAPMLCGGITAFHPLVQHNVGPSSKVGIIGLGGLGHFGLLGAAKALKCQKVVVISRTSAKKADAMKMGATDFIATDEDKDWSEKHGSSLDVIVSTVSSHKMPLQGYLNLLGRKGVYVHVGAPEDVVPPFNMFSLIPKRASIQGSQTGSRRDIEDMLKLFAETGVRTWNNNMPMKEANQAVLDMDAGKARYRYVLCHEDHIKEVKYN